MYDFPATRHDSAHISLHELSATSSYAMESGNQKLIGRHSAAGFDDVISHLLLRTFILLC